MTDLSDLTVLVTGATAGFGAATARHFAAEGARVIATGRRVARLEALVEEWGDQILPLAFDVGDRAAVDAALARLEGPFAEVDVLVNNAGLALGVEPAHRASLDEWETMVRTNVLGVLYVTRALLPGMVARQRGHIVNLGSIAGDWPYPGGNVYGGTKAFLAQLGRNLRCELLGSRVRVTSIEPGLAETEFSVVRFRGDADQAEKPYAGVEPLTADDIAEAILWAVRQPRHVNVNRIEIMATEQAWGPFAIHREA